MKNYDNYFLPVDNMEEAKRYYEEILGIDLENEIQKKVYKNSKREYKVIDGVNTRVKEFEDDLER